MDDAILKKLERRTDRRSFLRGSAFAAATVAAAAVPWSASAQDQPQEPQEPKKDGEPAGEPGQDPYKVTKKDDQGRDYRTCPQCGSNMYRQDKTWTCENCGYSYDE